MFYIKVDREPGGLPSMGSHRVGHNGSDLAAAAADISSHKGWWSKIKKNGEDGNTVISFFTR